MGRFSWLKVSLTEKSVGLDAVSEMSELWDGTFVNRKPWARISEIQGAGSMLQTREVGEKVPESPTFRPKTSVVARPSILR